MPKTSKSSWLARLAGAVAWAVASIMPVPAGANVAKSPFTWHWAAPAGQASAAPPPSDASLSAPSEASLSARDVAPAARLDSDGVTLVVRARRHEAFLFGVARAADAAPAGRLAVAAREAPPSMAVPPADPGVIDGEVDAEWRDVLPPEAPTLAADPDPEAPVAPTDGVSASEQGLAECGDHAAAAALPEVRCEEIDRLGHELAALAEAGRAVAPRLPESPRFWAPTADGRARCVAATAAEKEETLRLIALWAANDQPPGSHPFGCLGWDEARLSRALHVLRDVLRGRAPGTTWRLTRGPAAGSEEGRKAALDVEATAELFWTLGTRERFVLLGTALKVGKVAAVQQREMAPYLGASQKWVSRVKRSAMDLAQSAYDANWNARADGDRAA